MNNKSRLVLMTLCVFCLSILLSAAVAGQAELQGNDKGNKNVNKIIHLEPAAADSKATGIAKISMKVKGKKPTQTFQVVGANLKDGVTYDLYVNGNKVASQKAGVDADEDREPGEAGAAVEFLFSSKAKAGDDADDGDADNHGPQPLPDSLKPVTSIDLVELKEGSTVVLSGKFSSSTKK